MEVTNILTPNTLFFLVFIGGGMAGVMLQTIIRIQINRGKVWLYGIDPRTKLGFVKRVLPDKKGKINDDPLIVVEEKFVAIDKVENRPMYSADLASAKLFTPDVTGTIQTQGASASKRYRSNMDIERVSVAGQAINWAMIACIIGGVIILFLCVVAFMVSRLAPNAS